MSHRVSKTAMARDKRQHQDTWHLGTEGVPSNHCDTEEVDSRLEGMVHQGKRELLDQIHLHRMELALECRRLGVVVLGCCFQRQLAGVQRAEYDVDQEQNY